MFNVIKKTTTTLFGLTLLAGSILMPTPQVQAADGTVSLTLPSGINPTGNETICIFNNIDIGTPSNIVGESNTFPFILNLPSDVDNDWYAMRIYNNPNNMTCQEIENTDNGETFLSDTVFPVFEGKTTTMTYNPSLAIDEKIKIELNLVDFLDTSNSLNNPCGGEYVVGTAFTCNFNLIDTNTPNYGSDFTTSGGGIHTIKLRNVETNLESEIFIAGANTDDPAKSTVCYPLSYDINGLPSYTCNFGTNNLPAGTYEVLLDFGSTNYQNTGVMVDIVDSSTPMDFDYTISCDDYVISKKESLTCYVDLPKSLSSAEKQDIINTTKLGVTGTSYINPEGNFYNSEYKEYAGDCMLYGEDDLKCTFEFGKARKAGNYNMYIGIPSSDGVIGFFEVTYLADGTVKIKTLRTGGFNN